MALSDNFNRADGALGSNWTSPISNISGATGQLAIASNLVKAVTDDTHSFAIWSANSWSNNQSAQITIGPVSGNNWIGVILRAEINVDRFYVAFPFGNQYQIFRRWDGAFTQLATSAPGVAFVPGDIIKAEIIGSVHPITINMYKNGGLITTWTSPDATYVKTGGSAGMGLYSPAGWNLRLDDWVGTGEIPNIPIGLTSISTGMVGQYQKHFA